jgi:PAS domain S-box-containing protein
MIHILMVEDNPNNSDTGKSILEQNGDIQVTVSNSIDEAKDNLDENFYDAIISNFEVDSIIFLKNVRSKDCDVPYLIYNGKKEADAIIKALNYGADYYIQKEKDKNLEFIGLSHHIHRIINGRHSELEKEKNLTEKQINLQYNLVKKLSGVIYLDEALKLCIETAMRVSGMDCGGIYLQDKDSGDLYLKYAINLSDEFIKAKSCFKADSYSAHLVTTGHPIYAKHEDILMQQQEIDKKENLHAAAIIPILHQDRVIGCYNIASHYFDEVPMTGRKALESIALQIGNSIARIQAEEIHRQDEEIKDILFENPLEGILILDFEGNILYANHVLLEMAGVQAIENSIGLSIYSLVDPEYHETVRRDQQLVKDGESGFLAHYKGRDVNGKEIWVEGLGTKISYQGQEANIVFLRDISFKKEMEDKLIKSQEQLKLAIDGANLGIWDWDIDRNKITCNNRLAKMLGYSKEELEDFFNMLNQLINPNDRVHVEHILQEHLRGMTPYFESEFRIKCKDGHWKWAHEKGRVVEWDDTGRPIRMIGVHQDKKLSILSSVVRHDINNQVTAIALYIDLLRELIPEDPTTALYINDIKKLTDIIKVQIAFTRDYDDMAVSAPLWQHLDSAIRKAAKTIPLGDINLQVKTGSLEIFADRMLLKVFTNLFENTIRHGKEATEIRISFYEKDGHGIIVVEDDGTGIASKIKSHIFEPSVGKNTGYGLFLVKEILSITGMGIEETGEEGKGARFEIEIPGDHHRMDKVDSTVQ